VFAISDVICPSSNETASSDLVAVFAKDPSIAIIESESWNEAANQISARAPEIRNFAAGLG
jgi:hypothetical protein